MIRVLIRYLREICTEKARQDPEPRHHQPAKDQLEPSEAGQGQAVHLAPLEEHGLLTS